MCVLLEGLAHSHYPQLTHCQCRQIQELHRCAALRLGVHKADTAEMEELLAELAQLLVGISIMQVLTAGACVHPTQCRMLLRRLLVQHVLAEPQAAGT